jgi:MinD-like ATPase involved in chromosome partitioning or flagellar assembly
MTDEPQIVTFYSYKGGTGRTMALANVAWILASSGKRVLAVDWDLEAPGLHRYFHPFLLDKECRSSPGVIDMVWDVSVSAMKPSGSDTDPGWYRQYADVLKYAVSLRWPFPNGGTLDLLPAGSQGGSYAARVNSFNWKNFYERFGGGGYLDAVVTNMRKEYQYVLIDSRTGVSDTSGICTVQLPDTLVVCFTLNTQSIEGSAAVTQSVIDQRGGRPLRVLPVPMRLEDGEKRKLDAGLDYAHKRFASFARMPPQEFETYWGEVAVPYKRFYAYEEVLATSADRAKQAQALLPTAEKLTSYLTRGAVTAIARITETERRRWLAEFERVPDSGEPPFAQGLAALRDGNLDLAKQQLLRAVHDAEASGDQALLADASHQLSVVARGQGDLESAEMWYRRAVGQPAEQLVEKGPTEETELLQRRVDDVVQRWEEYRKHNVLEVILDRRAIRHEVLSLDEDAIELARTARVDPAIRPSMSFEISRTLRRITPESLTKPFRKALMALAASSIASAIAGLITWLTALFSSRYIYDGLSSTRITLILIFVSLAFLAFIGFMLVLPVYSNLRRQIYNDLGRVEDSYSP